MKKIYSILMVAVMCLTGTLTANAAATYYVVDGIRYYASSTSTKSVQVTALQSGKYSGDIVIPGSFEYNSTTYTVTGIKGSAFDGCNNLTSVTVEEGPSTLAAYSFNSCSALETITLPSTISSAEYYVFSSCSSLTTITFNGTTPPSTDYSGAQYMIYSCNSLEAIYVPGEAVDTWKTSWSQYATLFQALSTSSCAAVGKPEYSNVTAHSAKLTWAAATDVENYQFSCVRKGLEPVFGDAQNVLTVTIDTLAAETEYDFYVRSYCGDGEGEQGVAKSVSFETEVACAAPTALEVSDVTLNSAVISWTSSASAWNLEWKAAGDEDWNSEAVTENPYTLTGLNAATTYNVRVQANCGLEDGTSAFTATESFSTELCAEEDKKAISYTLTDSWGDGWNGDAAINVIHKNTGKQVAQLKLPNASGNSKLEGTLPLCCGEEYSFVWVAGSYDSECGFSFADINDAEIYTSSSTPTAGEIFAYTMNCAVAGCAKPTDLKVDATTAEGATLSWKGDATDYQYAVVDNGAEEPTEWTLLEGAKTITIEGKNANTSYDFYVRAYCGDGEGEQSAAISKTFKTDCGVQTLPLEEDFSGDINCWTLVDCNSSTKVTSGEFKFNYPDFPQFLITPELEESEKELKVEFKYKSGGYMTETFHVGYSTTTKDTASFVWSEEIAISTSTYGDPYSQKLPAGVKYVAIKYTSDDKYALYIDNFSVAEVSEATALENMFVNGKSIKRLENGQLVIENNGVIYNAQGVRVGK